MSASGCPHQAGQKAPASEGALNPSNAMPADLHKQLPSPGQRVPLSTERQTSSIPKQQQGYWEYPSPQMFYNAMKRKGWRPQEEDVNAVVAIHNAVNEKAWDEVRRWEATLHPKCEPKLISIRGLSQTHSPKARLFTLLGYEAPFDRHDWQVDRCGEQVRYIIDYYSQTPSSDAAVGALQLDVRPALDSPTAAWDRLRKIVKN
jgi:cytochrome c heme-lyase